MARTVAPLRHHAKSIWRCIKPPYLTQVKADAIAPALYLRAQGFSSVFVRKCASKVEAAQAPRKACRKTVRGSARSLA